jgi:hypothetical protein
MLEAGELPVASLPVGSIIHRDVKPEKVASDWLLASRGEEEKTGAKEG